jgi:hypothetical protein
MTADEPVPTPANAICRESEQPPVTARSAGARLLRVPLGRDLDLDRDPDPDPDLDLDPDST